MKTAIITATAALLAVVAFAGSAASGPVFTPVVAFTGYDSLDPANAYLTASWQVEYSTCVTLMSYSDDPAPAGAHLIPDAAIADPTVSSDGRTYTFTIRSGLGFSDGSGSVDALSFKRELQRVAVLDSPGFPFMSNIVGAASGSSTVSGVDASGNTLTVHLSSPDAAFPAKMAMGFFCAVPSTTALTASDTASLPTAGPYAIDSVTLSGSAITGFHLVRNTHYGGDRPATFDELVVTVQDASSAYSAATAGSPTVDFTSVASADRASAA